MLTVNGKPLSSAFFLAGPIRIGRLGLAIDRRFTWYPNRYRAGMWTSVQFAWLRVYWYRRGE